MSKIHAELDSEVIKILKSGGVAVIPTDTVYGVVGTAMDPAVVDRIYKLRKRKLGKPFIVLIASMDDLKRFDIVVSLDDQGFLNAVWPGKVSVVLPCPSEKYTYLHRGLNALAFRVPRGGELRELLEKTGPLVAPSANPEGEKTAETIEEAKNYFGEEVDNYVDGGKLSSDPSTLIKIENGKIEVLRQGAGAIRK